MFFSIGLYMGEHITIGVFQVTSQVTCMPSDAAYREFWRSSFRSCVGFVMCCPIIISAALQVGGHIYFKIGWSGVFVADRGLNMYYTFYPCLPIK